MPVLLHCCHMAELRFAYVEDCYIPLKVSKAVGNLIRNLSRDKPLQGNNSMGNLG